LCALLCPAISFLHFHVLQFHVLHFHVLHFQSVIFMSCNFMSCTLVRQFHVLQFHALQIGPSISRPSFSRPAFSAPPSERTNKNMPAKVALLQLLGSLALLHQSCTRATILHNVTDRPRWQDYVNSRWYCVLCSSTSHTRLAKNLGQTAGQGGSFVGWTMGQV